MTFHAACARILRAEAPRLGYTRQFTIYDQADSRRLVKRCLDELGVDPKRFTPAARPAPDLRREEQAARRGGLPPARRLLLRADGRRRLRALRARLHADERDGLRRPARPHGQRPRAVPGGPRALRRRLPPRARRRVPGHEPRPVPAAAAPGRRRARPPQPHGGRRRRAVDLRLPRRGHPQHPRFPGRLPGRRRSSGSSRTTARRRRSSAPPTRSSPTTAGRWPSTSGPTSARATRSRSASSTTSTPRRATSWARSSGSSTRACQRAEIAVFYRMNAQSRVLEDTLVRREIGYQVIGGTKFYERAEIKDAMAYLTVAGQPAGRRLLHAGRQLAASAGSGRPRSRACSPTPRRWASRSGTRRPTPSSVPGLGTAAVRALEPLHGRRWRGCASAPSSGVPVGDLLEAVLDESGYLDCARGRAHDRGPGAPGEPRGARRGRARVRRRAPRRTATRSTRSCSRSRSSPTATSAATTRAS